MDSLHADSLKPGMVLKDSSKNVYLVVSRSKGKIKLLMIGQKEETATLISLSDIKQWQDMELSEDKLDWGHLRDAILGWDFVPVYKDASLTLEQINKLFGTDVSLKDLLKKSGKDKEQGT